VVLGICGILLSQSRGGLLALLAGLVVLLPLGRARAWLAVAAAILLLVGLGVGLASWLGHEEQRLQTAFFASGGSDPSLSMRSDIWGRTFRVLADHPWTGTGLGTFRWAYGGYDREGEWLATEQAHNDYLQLASETGLPGIALMLWCVAAFGIRVLRPALRGGDGPPPWTTTALAAAVFAMLGHSVIEFNLQIPAVAALFAVAAGALAAAAEDRDGREGEAAS
jgi:O-antigen ligase